MHYALWLLVTAFSTHVVVQKMNFALWLPVTAFSMHVVFQEMNFAGISLTERKQNTDVVRVWLTGFPRR